MNKEMNLGVSHDFKEETLEAKARWFQSLTLAQRMDIFCELTEMILSINPRIMELKDASPKLTLAQPIPGRVLVLTAPQS